MNIPMSKLIKQLNAMPELQRAEKIYQLSVTEGNHLPHRYTVDFAASFYRQQGDNEKAAELKEADASWHR